ncbi:MAG TPA: SapC family protein [Stellaceae bacterium]|nr:SapC family protein [Stellaceae bacterium]
MAQQSAPHAEHAVLPMFYKRPFALRAGVHSEVSLKRDTNYRFAAKTNAIPLTLQELYLAQRDYPIVFTDEVVSMPMGVVGLRDQANLYVEPDGSWRRGAYVPAYVRRYPFLFLEQPGSTDLTLCIDEASDFLEATTANPFFRDGKATEVTQKALEFCSAYQRQHEATREFGRTLAQVELLVPRDATVKLPNGESIVVRGFKMIDEPRFNTISAETFQDWRSKGWISMIYAHFLSLGAWDRLVQVLVERGIGGRS